MEELKQDERTHLYFYQTTLATCESEFGLRPVRAIVSSFKSWLPSKLALCYLGEEW